MVPMKISRRPYLKALEAETVVLHTRDGSSIRGVLLAVHADVYVLRHAAYLNGLTGESPFPDAFNPTLTPDEVLAIAGPFIQM